MSDPEREALLAAIAELSLRAEWAERPTAWKPRPNQIAPVRAPDDPAGDWLYWLLLAGRGFGKTRTAAEWILQRVAQGARHIIIAGATAGDVRDIIVDGESGILAISPPWNFPVYEPSKNRLTWPSGAKALCLSAEEPDRFRGKQCDTFWLDELAAYAPEGDTAGEEAFTQLLLGFRLGRNYGVTPRGVISTTPRPTRLIRRLVKDSRAVITKGSTFENAANLTTEFLAEVKRKYEHTRLGRQELYAEVLDEAEGALWKRDLIDRDRETDPEGFDRSTLTRIVVAIDPAVTANKDSDETGIVAGGTDAKGHGFVLADRSGRYTPDGWARAAIALYDELGADRIVAETNQGGDMIESTLRSIRPNISYSSVRAARGKRARAEPVAALYEQKRVHHVGYHAELEEQMCTWDAARSDKSPDRIDALVWLFTELLVNTSGPVDWDALNEMQSAMPQALSF